MELDLKTPVFHPPSLEMCPCTARRTHPSNTRQKLAKNMVCSAENGYVNLPWPFSDALNNLWQFKNVLIHYVTNLLWNCCCVVMLLPLLAMDICCIASNPQVKQLCYFNQVYSMIPSHKISREFMWNYNKWNRVGSRWRGREREIETNRLTEWEMERWTEMEVAWVRNGR
jgi:hypothetical protein